MSEFEVKFPREDQPSRIVNWKVSEGSVVTAGKVILIYADVATGKMEKRMKATKFGTVIKTLVKNNETVHPGQPILLMEPCKHLAVMKDLCANCGADLRVESINSEKSAVSQAVVPMVHSIPELKVAPELAEKIGREDIERLLRDKKLVLLVDLDQTIVHTTNDNVPADEKDVYHFQLYGPNSPWYHTRLRPHTRQFFSEISKYYELHICSFGVRQYAHYVTSIIDNDGKLFSHRILSRDECFDAQSKTANLKALFPVGVDMVCIIDDRDDVWQGCANLVQVKPYVYFSNTGDINVPPGLAQHSNPEASKTSTVESNIDNNKAKQETDCDKEVTEEDKKDVEKKSDEAKDENSESDQKIKEKENIKETEENSVSNDHSEDTEEKQNSNKSRKRRKEKEKPAELSQSFDLSREDHDDYLLYLEDILKRIHTEFYTETTESVRIKSLTKIIPKVRSRVLEGVHLTFSGIIPNNTELQQSRAYKVARAFGAQVSKDLCKETTHLVAIQLGTVKVREAKKNKEKKIKIVHPDWLWTCAERWEHVDERLYPVTSIEKETLKQRDSRKPPPHCGTPEYVVDYMPETETFAQTINPLMAMASEDIEDMTKEVDEDLSDLDEESSEDENNPRKRGSNDSDSDQVYGQDDSEDEEKFRFFANPKKRKYNTDNESASEKEDEDEEDDDDDDPATHFRRGGGLPEDFDENTEDSVDHLINENLEDDREYVAMSSAIEREFLSDN